MDLIIIFSTILLTISIFIVIGSKTKLIDKKTRGFNLLSSNDFQKYLIGGLILYSSLFSLNFYFVFEETFNYLLIISLLILITGVIDDFITLPVFIRLLIQFLAALLITLYGVKIISLGYLIDDREILLGYFSIFFSVLCLVVLINAFNFFDGIDGNASATSLFCFLSLVVLVYLENEVYLININKFFLIILICLVFLLFLNVQQFFKFKIFLGDAGSTLLGFIMGTLLILYSQPPYNYFHPVLCIWCISFPIYDFLNVTIKRLIKNKNPMRSDDQHIHYILTQYGISNITSISIITFISTLFLIIGYLSLKFINPLFSLVLYIIFFIFYFILTEHFYRKKNK